MQGALVEAQGGIGRTGEDFGRQMTEAAENLNRLVSDVLNDLQKDVKAEIATMDRSQETRRKLLITLKSELKVDGDVLIDEANGVLRLTEAAVQFETSQSILLDRYKFNVGKIARVLERVIPDFVACRIAAGQNRCRTGLDLALKPYSLKVTRNRQGRGGAMICELPPRVEVPTLGWLLRLARRPTHKSSSKKKLNR